MRRSLPAALFLAAAFTSPSIREAATAPKPVKHPVVTVHTNEFAFTAPASIAAGTTTFRLVNDGKELHQVSIIQLADGKTLADFVAAVKAHTPMPWATGVGGPNAAGPGKTIDATVTLDAGSYILVCFIPSPGEQMPHMAKGMVRALTVTTQAGPAKAGASTSYLPESAPDVHLELSDYAFKFSKPLVAGKHTVHVMNTASQEHEVVFVKLAPGKTMEEFGAWAENGMKGPPPAEPIPGMAGLGKGRTGIFEVNLAPGTYGLICFAPDAMDGKSHASHGMVQQFTVAAK